MRKFRVGDKAKITHMPNKGSHLVNKVVIVIPIGGIGYEDDDVCVKLEDGGQMFFVKENQLQMISRGN